MKLTKSLSRSDLYDKAFRIIGQKTPLAVDCGQLCDHACCKGDAAAGMELFPGEYSPLPVMEAEGIRLAVCGGSCDREARPLACRIFPFFPIVDRDGSVSVEIDPRAAFLCPIAAHGPAGEIRPQLSAPIKTSRQAACHRPCDKRIHDPHLPGDTSHASIVGYGGLRVQRDAKTEVFF